MSGLVGPTGAPLSQRKVRDSVEQQQEAMRSLLQAFSMFLGLSFVGRVKWLLFGISPVRAIRRREVQSC